MEEHVRTRVSAYAIAVVQDRLLLTRLSANTAVFAPGLWHLPGGGIDPGEQPREALARELREETGLELLGARLVEARTFTSHRLGPGWQVMGLFYLAEVGPGPLRVTEVDGSTSAAAWMPLSGLEEPMLSPAAITALELIGT
ncbi:NUDIX hydrolase [Nonomuraea zeae]|uniref:NUDIX domain-containing protein n=1 Tax=Nonomuraea zeae TaxID=1642303 RepID=A0A5S4GMG2_9ACTN|nr:NUDIX domain-containing protein [Nonomuraea zeae]TMR34138.1 NUDIX domain-containing protein [Nonomuraea zeae]